LSDVGFAQVKLRALEDFQKKDAEEDAAREMKLAQLEGYIQADAAADAERERLIKEQEARVRALRDHIEADRQEDM
jgi:hypothetical protein